MTQGTSPLPDTFALAPTLAQRQLAERYALAADTGDGDMFAAQFTSDGELLAPRGRFAGHEALKGVPAMLAQRYHHTFHAVMNQVAEISGEQAKATTYSIARHYYNDTHGHSKCYEMTIRYQDEFRQAGGQWLFTRRVLVLDSTRSFPIDPIGQTPGPAGLPKRTKI